jgi:hypothetical protein
MTVVFESVVVVVVVVVVVAFPVSELVRMVCEKRKHVGVHIALIQFLFF